MEERFEGSRPEHARARPLPRVSTIFVRALLEAVETAGMTADDFSRAAGISHDQLADVYGWMEVSELDRLLGRAVELTADSAFGLHWVERSPLMKFDLLAMITASAPTLREALESLLRFQCMVFERPEVELVELEDRVQLRVSPVAATELGRRLRTEMAVLAFVRLMRYVGAPSSAVWRIAFMHRAPDYVQEYVRSFEGRATFGQTYSGIELDPAWLDRRLHHANVELHRLLVIQGQHVLANMQSSTGYSGQVRAYLRRVFPRLPQMPEAARALALSERSLRRRLNEEGFSYSAILQESQLRLARELLGDPTLSIQEIAHDVGFTSATAFHRAFKRWTGASPAAFRSSRPTPGSAASTGASGPHRTEPS